MEYIKKEKLIEGEIYKVQDPSFWMIGLVITPNNGDNYNLTLRGDATYITQTNEFKINQSWCYKSPKRNYQIATPEEKHWLNTCIKQDKFVTFEEAMKTFIPEYVECITKWNNLTIGKIYTFPNPIDDIGVQRVHIFNWKEWIKFFKPSTKEAYDAQFVVKEPEFVLPKEWCVKVTNENKDLINKLRKEKSRYCKEPILYAYLTSSDFAGTSFVWGTEITFEQFKKYVLKEETTIEFGNKIDKEIIKPLPQFKVIESVETITKVENNEGNQFFIGDVVKSLDSDQKGTIIKFRYSTDKSNIIAITTFQKRNGININKIEHYIK